MKSDLPSTAVTGADPERADPDERPLGSPWEDLRAYVAMPRLQSLRLSGDGATLLVSMSELDHDQTGYRTGWWRVDPAGRKPARRYTRSVEGESAAAFLPDGSLIFGSGRPAPPGSKTYGPKPSVEPTDDDGVLWCLPAAGGEAYPIARRYGGWQDVAIARNAPVAIFGTSAFPGTAGEAEDQQRRRRRKTKKINAVLHDGYPVRSWDHDLGASETRLYAGTLAAVDDAPDVTGVDHGDIAVDLEQLTVLAPGSGRRLDAVQAVAEDGTFAVAGWTAARPGGLTTAGLVEIDLATGDPTVRADEAEHDYLGAVLSPDGSTIAASRFTRGNTARPPTVRLWLIDRSTGAGRALADDWDRWPQPVAFAPDGGTLYVVADEDGHAPIFAVDVATGQPRRLTGDGAYGDVVAAPDGRTLYGLRSSYTDPGSVVAVSTADGTETVLRAPVRYPALPGRLSDVETRSDDGTRIRGYLALPDSATAASPAPLALWIHGGPLSSWNAWSWRWCPWLLVAAGYAVLLPDPALSTGYGQDFIRRGWQRWGAEPYTDLMAITDAVVDRADIDQGDTVAMGGSFGGYMANWVAGHTDRFGAIVSHAGLWNLDSFRYTTDAAIYWLAELTDTMVQQHSPHLFADKISTPMLVIHGDKDYRVPINEGIALWTSLNERHRGSPDELPHRFLYFPEENHWVLTPQHAIVWYDTVLRFLESVRTGGNFERSDVL